MDRSRRVNKKIIIERTVSSSSILHSVDVSHYEDVLARMIASVYATEHSDFFKSLNKKIEKPKASGPPAAAAAVTGAPPVNAGGPEKRMELEHHDNPCKTDNRPRSL